MSRFLSVGPLISDPPVKSLFLKHNLVVIIQQGFFYGLFHVLYEPKCLYLLLLNSVTQYQSSDIQHQSGLKVQIKFKLCSKKQHRNTPEASSCFTWWSDDDDSHMKQHIAQEWEEIRAQQLKFVPAGESSHAFGSDTSSTLLLFLSLWWRMLNSLILCRARRMSVVSELEDRTEIRGYNKITDGYNS